MSTKPKALIKCAKTLEIARRKLAALKEWRDQKGWGPERKTLKQIEREHGLEVSDD